MEFYLKDISVKPHLMLVSIPNGMEFYVNEWLCAAGYKFVSIPNGMEFYGVKAQLSNIKIEGFNSQRDGILRAV